MIYFIQAGSTGPIKIGYTESEESLKKRMEGLQTSSPYILNLLGTKNGDIKTEKFIQKKFQMLKLAGEWFQPDPILLNFIKNTLPDESASCDLVGLSLKEIIISTEKKYIEAALWTNNNNVFQAARILKINVKTLHYKIKKYNLLKSKG